MIRIVTKKSKLNTNLKKLKTVPVEILCFRIFHSVPNTLYIKYVISIATFDHNS